MVVVALHAAIVVLMGSNVFNVSEEKVYNGCKW